MTYFDYYGYILRPHGSDAGWLKVNVGTHGYYRVNYPDADWESFSRALAATPDVLPACDRTGLLADAFAMAAAGRLSYDIALDLTKYMREGETSLAPWEVVIEKLGHLSTAFDDGPLAGPLKKFKLSLVSRLRDELGWNDDGAAETKLLRSALLDVSGQCGHQETLDRAKTMLLQWKNEGVKIKPNLRGVVYKNGIKQLSSDRQVWDWLLERYKSEQNAQEKLKILRGLASTEEPDILKHILKLAKDEDVVRSQDYFTLLTFMSGSEAGRAHVWDFLTSEWNYLVDRFTLNDRLFARLLATVAEGFSSEKRLTELRTHFDKHPEAGAGEQYRK